jgi:integrase
MTKRKEEIKELRAKEPAVESWLSEFGNPRTGYNYADRLLKYFQDTKFTVADLQKREPKEIKHLLLQYQSEQQKANVPQNSILAVVTSVRSFCSSLDKPIKFRRGQLGSLQADTSSHVFSNGDLRTIFEIGNTTEKAIIATSASLGWEISAFLELLGDKVSRLIAHAKQNNEEFIFFDDTRAKTGVSRLAILNPLAIEWLGKYLETNPPATDKLFDFTSDGINKMLARLAKTSGLKTTGGIRYHNIRKWLMSRLSRAGFNEFQIKFIIGHSIPLQDRTYLQTLKEEITEKYPRVYNDYLNIYPKINAEAKGELNAKILEQNRLITNLTMTLDAFKQEIQEIKQANAQTKAELEAYAQLLPEDKRESFRRHVTKIRARKKT